MDGKRKRRMHLAHSRLKLSKARKLSRRKKSVPEVVAHRDSSSDEELADEEQPPQSDYGSMIVESEGGFDKFQYNECDDVEELMDAADSDDEGAGDICGQSDDSDEVEPTLVDGREGGGGDESSSGGVGSGTAGGVKKKVKIPGLYKPPTHEELQNLKETQNLFKSNLMRLQITELLSEIQPKRGTASTKQLEEKLHSIKEFISSLPPTTQQIDLCDGNTLLPKKVKYPLKLDISGVKGKFQFMPPSAVKVVGSYLLGTTVRPHLNVDIALSIPVECLQAKDLLNYRYFHKRALYLSIIAGHLRKKRKQLGIKDISFSFASGNPLLPIILLQFDGKGVSKYTIRVHTSIADSNYFKMSRLSPDRNNVRPDFLESTDHQSDLQNQSDQSLPGPPTPHYNATLLMELGAMERHLKELYDVTQQCPAVVDAVMLSKIWLKQRGLENGYGGFTGFHFAMMMSWLLHSKKINRLMSSYQILRIAFQTISTGDWTSQGLSMAQEIQDTSQPSLDTFHTSFDVVFVDSTGYLNLCANMSKERYLWLKHEASAALSFLDDLSINGFEALFMNPVSHLQKFDVLCCISPGSVFLPSLVPDDATRQAILLDGAVWPLPLLLGKVMPILHRGLEKRVKLLTVLPENEMKWLPTNHPPTPSDSHVTIGLLLDTDHAFSIVNMGPPADSSEALEFHSFWGDKSELRRFQDGSINEAVVWGEESVGGVAGKRIICHRIIQHLLQRHANISPDHVTCSANQLDSLISLPSYSPVGGSEAKVEKSSVCVTGEEVNRKVMDVFTELSRELRQLRDIPLSINSLQGTSPVFRYTEVFPPVPWNGHLSSKMRMKPPTDDFQSDCYYPSCDSATPPYVPALNIVCQLESSGKWPEEVNAIDKIKTAFYVHMAKALKGKRGVVASPTKDYLDILKDGYVFRLRIHYPRQLSVIEEAIGSSDSQTEVVRLKSKAADLKKALVSLPVHTSTLHGLHQQYPSYGTGTRLCKRWVSAHLLSNHLSDEAVELMVAHLFVSPAPFTLPGSPLTVFLRFLSLLSSHDWASDPLIINFNNELSSSEIAEMVSKFSSMRASFPPIVLATPHDKLPTPWTSNSAPSQPVLLRLQLLAKESLSLLERQLSGASHDLPMDVRQAFRPPLDDYNVLIHLHKRHLPFSHQAVDAIETSSSHQSHDHKRHQFTHLPVVDFNPVQLYLKELEATFSEFCLFFYDGYGGDFIAVVWKPTAFQTQSFKIMQAHCRVLEEGLSSKSSGTGKGEKKRSDHLLVPDTEAILADFQLMGEGLVKRVEVLSPPPSSS